MVHKDDQMTPRQRSAALAKGQAVDRMPIALFYGSPAPGLMGWSRTRAYGDAESMAQTRCRIYETFGCDNVGVEYGLHGMAITYGAEVSDDHYNPPAIIRHPVSLDDLSVLDANRLSVKNDKALAICLEAAKRILDRLGDEVGCGMELTGPLTCAAGLVGTEALLKAMLRQPEKVHQLMAFVNDVNIETAKAFVAAGCGLSVSDPIASGTVISPRLFRKFVQPYHQKFVAACHAMGESDPGIHICGDTSPILEDIADCGYRTVSIDNKVDLADAKRRIGDRAFLLGNVDPVNVFFNGTEKEMRRAVRRCYRKAWDNPCGFMLAPGCGTAYGTPVENAMIYMDEARKCARYPVDPTYFMEEE